MHSISLGEETIYFEIKRGRRKKSLAILVDPRAQVIVLAPRCLQEEKIRAFVQTKARWIMEKQELVRISRSLNPPKEFVNGETFPYLGRQYRLEIIQSSVRREEKCRLIRGRLKVEIGQGLGEKEARARVRRALLDWYFERAAGKIRERIDPWAARIGRWPQGLEIKDHRARWGSCSPSGIVRFNWKIIMAPLPVVDYVIVHELCHLFHLHHSLRFWQKVRSILPDYQKSRLLLRQSRLAFEDTDVSDEEC